MSDAINSVLSQIRSLQQQAAGRAVAPAQAQAASAQPSGFGDAMTRALKSVNETQKEASSLATRFELGDSRVDLARVMLKSQEANVGFKAVAEVRNRMVSAYQDVMNMPI
jgi:flagellar hook-basal body complex protein FliE